MFNSDFYIKNRAALKSRLKVKVGVIVIAGNGLLQRSADTNFKFRQDSNLLYLTGITEPCAVFIADLKTGNDYLYIPEKVGYAAIFDGVTDHRAVAAQSGIKSIITSKKQFEQLLKNKKVWLNYADPTKRDQLFSNPYQKTIHARLKRIAKEVSDIRPILASMRMVKQPDEIKAISSAASITMAALTALEQNLPNLKSEDECLRIINTIFAQNGTLHAYEPIVASGNNANTLHYVHNNGPLVVNSCLLIDAGAEFCNYAADISRTYVKGNNVRLGSIINAVESVQKEIINYIAPGKTWQQVANRANSLLFVELKKLKITNNKNDVQIYFPHAFGHFLGLDVHDVGDYKLPLQENMVLTVEPGIYLPHEGVGVRIEDDVLVTQNGSKVL